MEEGEPPGTGSAQEDQQGVDEFEYLGEVEHVSPEEGWSTGRGVVEWEANGPAEVVGRRLVEGGEGASDAHEEGEEAEDEVVEGGDEAECGGGKGGEDVEMVEGECKGEVDGDGECDELFRRADGVVGFPLILADGWMVN